ncbi:MAG: hypothetical protein EOM47_01170 [Bacteroidia bacterium]|nr:hypothetical protein [Bacteroidia bacterium]
MNEYKPIGVDSALNLMVQLFGRPYIVPGDEKAEQIVGAYNVTVQADDEYDRLSQFGTPVLGSFRAEAGTYKAYDNNDKLSDLQIDDFEFPVASIVEFSRRKGTVVTETIGGKGSVKEIMGLSDWVISIRGLIVQDDSRNSFKTVAEQQKQLDKLNEVAGAIKINGKLFFERDIHHILIQELRYTPVQGKPGLVQYEIDALSDEEFFF